MNTRRRAPIAFLALAWAAVASGASGPPDWVSRARSTPVPPLLLAADPAPDAVYLWRQRIITASPGAGTTKLFDRDALKVLTPEGIDSAIFSSAYDDDSSVSVEGAWSVHAAGATEKLDPQDVVTAQVGSAEYFTDQHVVAFRPPRLVPGDVAAYALSRKSHRDVYQWIVPLQGAVPVVAQEIVVDLPEGWRHRWRLTAAPEGYGGPLAGEGGNRARYAFGAQRGIPPEESAPPVADRAASLEVALVPPAGDAAELAFQKWDDVARWFWRRSEPARSAAPPVSIPASPDPIASAAEWVQDRIRYVAVEVGESAYVPRTPVLVASRRYGDCKDKGFLLRALLDRNGTKAYPVLTRGRANGTIDSEFPSPVQFNHLIVAIHETAKTNRPAEILLADGPAMLFDPTSEETPYGELPPDLQGSRGLVVTEDRGQIVDFPWGSNATNRWKRRVEATVGADGGLSADVADETTGASAARGAYRDLVPAEREKRLARWATREIAGSHVDRIAFHDLERIDRPLGISYRLSSDGFLRSAGGLTLLPVLPLSVGPRRVPNLSRRVAAIELGPPRYAETVETIRLPPNFRLDGVPDPVQAENAYGRYAFSARAAPNAVTVDEVFEVKRARVPPGDRAAWKALEDAAARAAAAKAILVPAN